MSSYAIKALAKKYNVDYDDALNYADYVILRISEGMRGPNVWHQKAIDRLEVLRHDGTSLDQDAFIKDLLSLRAQRRGA